MATGAPTATGAAVAREAIVGVAAGAPIATGAAAAQGAIVGAAAGIAVGIGASAGADKITCTSVGTAVATGAATQGVVSGTAAATTTVTSTIDAIRGLLGTAITLDAIYGYRMLGQYRPGTGNPPAYIQVPSGQYGSAMPGTLEWAIENNPWPWVPVVMACDYWPATLPRYPVRAFVRAGEGCAWPAVEALALVQAGAAVWAPGFTGNISPLLGFPS